MASRLRELLPPSDPSLRRGWALDHPWRATAGLATLLCAPFLAFALLAVPMPPAALLLLVAGFYVPAFTIGVPLVKRDARRERERERAS